MTWCSWRYSRRASNQASTAISSRTEAGEFLAGFAPYLRTGHFCQFALQCPPVHAQATGGCRNVATVFIEHALDMFPFHAFDRRRLRGNVGLRFLACCFQRAQDRIGIERLAGIIGAPVGGGGGGGGGGGEKKKKKKKRSLRGRLPVLSAWPWFRNAFRLWAVTDSTDQSDRTDRSDRARPKLSVVQEDLAWIEDVVGVECPLDRFHVGARLGVISRGM